MSTTEALMAADKRQYNNEEIQIIKDQIARGATDQELTLFVKTCERLGLDPFARQIFAVKRWDSRSKKEIMSTQVSIDGLRLVADRTGKYLGQTEPQWCGADGIWREVWLDDKPPAAARVGVFRQGVSAPTYAVATLRSFGQTNRDGKLTFIWAKMPDIMLLKCAEAQALRKAFPAELSGVYSDDEMAQAATQEPLDVTPPEVEKIKTPKPTAAKAKTKAPKIPDAEIAEPVGPADPAERLTEALDLISNVFKLDKLEDVRVEVKTFGLKGTDYAQVAKAWQAKRKELAAKAGTTKHTELVQS